MGRNLGPERVVLRRPNQRDTAGRRAGRERLATGLALAPAAEGGGIDTGVVLDLNCAQARCQGPQPPLTEIEGEGAGYAVIVATQHAMSIKAALMGGTAHAGWRCS
jgi:hypothetical protein